MVADRLVELSELECLVSALWYLSNYPSRLARHDAEAGNCHVRRDNRAIEYSSVIFDGRHLANNHSLADVDVASNACSLDDRVLPDEDMVAHSEG